MKFKFSDTFFVSNTISAIGESFLKSTIKPVTDEFEKTKKFTIDMSNMEATNNTNGNLTALNREGPLVEEFDFNFDSSIDDIEAPGIFGSLLSDNALRNEHLFEHESDLVQFKEAISELDRVRIFDTLMPSYHNAITVSCLHVLCKWMMAELLPTDLSLFHSHTRYGHFLHVRLAAIDCFILLDGLFNENMLYYLLELVDCDPVPSIRYHTVKSLVEYCLLCGTRSDDDAASKVHGRWSDVRTLFGKWTRVKDKVWSMIKYVD